jgi:sulfite reductase (ferredoxin)
MLLITRGVEAESESQVFELFLRYFIESGLVDASYTPLLDAAKNRDAIALRDAADCVFPLSETMEELYAKMDNSLSFPGEAAPSNPYDKSQGKPIPAEIETRDLRGVLCPMNFVKTKLALEAISSGQRLQILLDDGAPIHNVPRSVAEEGHRIVEQNKIGDHWAVIIEKR